MAAGTTAERGHRCHLACVIPRVPGRRHLAVTGISLPAGQSLANRPRSSRSSVSSCSARDALLQVEGARTDVDRLAKLVDEMDELFLLVIVGEYNSGKSTFINALLGDEVFAMGDLPTTREIAILRFGDVKPPETIGDHQVLFHYPLDVLRDLEIVDTPGTNSLERMEEDLTRSFVPRADLVLFVTSLLQPLTATELGFLTHIREWGKKVIFIVNGVDRRNSDEQVDRVRTYLDREITARLSGEPPTIYFISALQALRAKMAARAVAPGASSPPNDAESPPSPVGPDPRDAFPALERYLLETLRERERVRLKLLSPLGVLRRVLELNVGTLDKRLEVVHGDGQVLASVRRAARELWGGDAYGLGALPARAA